MIENKFGKDSIIIMGDWSIGKQMRNFISTPNIGLKRKLKENFRVYNIDEYNTSCINNKTEEKMENLKVNDWYIKKMKKDVNISMFLNKKRELHSVLTFKMENNRKGCINRYKNACLNMRKIFNYYIETGKRPEIYSRKNNKIVQP